MSTTTLHASRANKGWRLSSPERAESTLKRQTTYTTLSHYFMTGAELSFHRKHIRAQKHYLLYVHLCTTTRDLAASPNGKYTTWNCISKSHGNVSSQFYTLLLRHCFSFRYWHSSSLFALSPLLFILYASCAGQDHHKVLYVPCTITFMDIAHMGSKQATKPNALV
jgi:hypothetical protein